MAEENRGRGYPRIQGALANLGRHRPEVEQLIEKGFLKLNQQLTMDEKFEDFLKKRFSREQLRQWEQPKDGLGWRGWRWIFWPIILAVLVLLFGTGETWLKGATAYMTALAGLLELVWGVFSG